MNRWNIPDCLELEVRARDVRCIYCGVEMLARLDAGGRRAQVATWEHIINDARIITRENIALCCTACNASKGTKRLGEWLKSTYCKSRGITADTIARVAVAALEAEKNDDAQPPAGGDGKPARLISTFGDIKMNLISPIPFDGCLSILREQIQRLHWYSRIRLIHKYTSPVFVRVNDDGAFTLESSKDIFSKRLVGYLKKDRNRTRIEAQWSIPFNTKLYGSHQFDEEVIIGFLKDWQEIEPITEQSNQPNAE